MISVQNLSVSFGGELLFGNVSFLISPGDRIGLVGSNGAGKSTLMKVLLGLQPCDEGAVNASRHAGMGYLPQEGISLSNLSLRDEVLTAFKELNEVEAAIGEVTTELARLASVPDSQQVKDLVEELGELQARFEAMNGFAAAGQVEKILMGLGFLPSDLNRDCQQFSGGWQMRIELAKLLLRRPDLLMLDEPTNHLDIESLTWLEGFLQRYEGAILLISHDRSFLDALCTRTFELSRGALTTYTGNYTSYTKQRLERRAQQQAAYDNQQKAIADTKQFIERFRYKATKAVQVQSRIKALDKLERVPEPESDEASVKFAFPPAPRSGRLAVELKHIVKRYGDNLVLDDVEFALERGQKVAFLGRNGEGKSTLSRIIAGIEDFQGTRVVGHNVSVGYFAQHQAEHLNQKLTVLETLDAVAAGDIRLRLRSLLGAFLFQGDDVFKPVRVLSGGEKSRLALAKLLLQPTNLLIFDEPTNHLDMKSKKVLKDALVSYEGAIVIVSHDRDFLDGIVDGCVEFKDRKIKYYPGGVGDYLRRHNAGGVNDVFATRKNPNGQSAPAQAGMQPVQNDKDRKRRQAELRNKRYAATKELRKKLEKVESGIAPLEKARAECETALALPETYQDPQLTRHHTERLAKVTAQLNDLYIAWGKAAAELEAAEAGFTAGGQA